MFKRMLLLSVGMLFILTGMSSAEWGTAVNLGPNVNTIWNELGPSISSDSTKLYFVSDRPGGYGETDIWVSEYSNSAWQLPVNLGPNINDSFPQSSLCISSDGLKLYYGSVHIVVSYCSSGVWLPPVPTGPSVWPGTWNFAPSISYDEKKLYFMWSESSNPVNWKISVSEYGDTSWQLATLLGPNINGAGLANAFPCISSDGKKLYFASFERSGGYGGYDIWVSEWQEGKEEENKKDDGFGFLQSSPNPSNRVLTISYDVPVSGRVTLKIYDNTGHLVRTLIDEVKQQGNYIINWNGMDNNGTRVPVGTYFYQFKVGSFMSAKKAIVLR